MIVNILKLKTIVENVSHVACVSLVICLYKKAIHVMIIYKGTCAVCTW